MNRKLRDYQKKALRYCIEVSHPALFVEMGLGKTLTAIRYCKFLSIKKALIIAPLSTFYGWQREIVLEYSLKGIELLGAPQNRLKQLYSIGRYYLLNKEGIWSIPEIFKIDWDIVILDESTFIKAPPKKNKSERYGKRSNTSRLLCEKFRSVEHRMILTGTPAPENILNYFMQLQFLNPEILGFKNYYDFRFKHFFEDNHKFTMEIDYKKKFYKALKENCFFLSRKSAGLNIKKIYTTRKIKQTDAFKKIYDKLVEDFILEDKRTKYSPVQFVWLRQLCSGFINKELRFKEKLIDLKELLHGELKNKPVIIWTQFIPEIQMLHKELHNIVNNHIIYGEIAKITRDEIMLRFNKGEFNCIIAHPTCFKYGTDLSRADTMIYYSAPLGLESRLQSEARMTRIKKKESVLIVDMVVEDSIEEDILNGLQMKKSQSEIIKMMVRRINDKT